MKFPALQVAAALVLALGAAEVQAQGEPKQGQPPAYDRLDGAPALALSDAEKAIVLRAVDLRGESTLGLGSLTEGADVPRNAELRALPDSIVARVSKLRGYRYFTAEGRIAIVDPEHAKIRLLLGPRR